MCTNIFSILILFFLHLSFYAQNQTIEQYLISSAGGTFTTENSTLTFSVGEIATETFTSENLILTQGLLQAENISIDIDYATFSTSNIIIYPNPATSFFNIDFLDFNNSEPLEYLVNIIDINGKYILSKKIQTKSIKIDISTYLSGTYFIKLTNLINPDVQVKVIQKVSY